MRSCFASLRSSQIPNAAPSKSGQLSRSPRRLACGNPQEPLRAQAVALLHLRVAGIDRALAAGFQARVDLLEVASNQLLLGIRDPATVRLAGMFEGGVVDLGTLGASAASSGPGLRFAGASLRRGGVHEYGVEVLVLGQSLEGGQLDHERTGRRIVAAGWLDFQLDDLINRLERFKLALLGIECDGTHIGWMAPND